jgi:hypothetical protein
MVTFNRRVRKVLPYDRKQYLDFFGNDESTVWYGVSFQLPGGFEGRNIGITEFLEKYETWFKDLIIKLDTGLPWVINHDDKDLNWFPNDEDSLPSLRILFKQNNIPNNFRGALIFSTNELLEFTRDLLSYPTCVFKEERLLYKDLDISHAELPIVIKISAHWNIHLLSTDKNVLREILNENRSDFIIREYRGTLLT